MSSVNLDPDRYSQLWIPKFELTMLSNMLITWMTIWALLSFMKFIMYFQFQNDHHFQFLQKCFMWFLAHDFCLSIMHDMEWTSWHSQQTKEDNNKDMIWHLLILKSNLQDLFCCFRLKRMSTSLKSIWIVLW